MDDSIARIYYKLRLGFTPSPNNRTQSGCLLSEAGPFIPGELPRRGRSIPWDSNWISKLIKPHLAFNLVDTERCLHTAAVSIELSATD